MTLTGRLRARLARQDYGALALETVVVIFGILVAFQIDRWGEQWRDRQLEAEYLDRLAIDVALEIDSLDDERENVRSRLEALTLLERIAEDPEAARERAVYVPWAIETATWRSFPAINAFVYSEMQTTGTLGLLASDTLRRELAEYYATMRHYARVGEDRDAELQFDRLTAGLLSTAELLAVERGTWRDGGGQMSGDRAVEIARAFGRRPEALALLPSVTQHHAFNDKVMGVIRERAEQVQARLAALRAGGAAR